MDIVNDLRSLVTVFFLILFLGIVAWAYSSRNRSAFDEAASASPAARITTSPLKPRPSAKWSIWCWRSLKAAN